MKQRTLFLLSLVVAFVLTFALGKMAFLLYNSSVESSSLTDCAQVLWHGLPMDLSTTGYLIAFPWLCSFVAIWWKKMPFRRILLPYYIVVALVLTAIVVGDIVMYEFWKFKIDSTVFAYLHSTEGATSSVSMGFLLSRLASFVLVAGLLGWVLYVLTPSRLQASSHRLLHSLVCLLYGGIIFLFIRGGVQESTMNVGQAYFSSSLFLNHAAVNPAFSLLASVSKNKDFSRQFRYLSEEECEQSFRGLYDQSSSDTEMLTDTLLRIPRPNVLVCMLEGFGGKFVQELGGLPDVAPHLSRLIPEGVFFDNVFANSFRTDRGTVSLFSGWISYPNVSLMRIPGRTATLPSLAHSLSAEGYSCRYLYGGDIKIMGKRGYLVASGYETLLSEDDFTFSERNETKWGVNDSLTALRTFHEIRSLPTEKPWHMVFQTLSSHEPFEVPYHRLEDPVQNAFAYTDHCIGQLVDSLKTLPQWDDMLVVILPDHGFLYELTYQDPEFFHIPMLWLGGALKEPRRMSVLMNQSDLCATLLAQMGISHQSFPWSRNVLSSTYDNPFVYSTYPGGVLYRDSTGTTVFDITASEPILEQPAPNPERILKAKSILQTSYTRLQNK